MVHKDGGKDKNRGEIHTHITEQVRAEYQKSLGIRVTGLLP